MVITPTRAVHARGCACMQHALRAAHCSLCMADCASLLCTAQYAMPIVHGSLLHCPTRIAQCA
eukprot:2583954-Lingulodinium_polyedra.AAC.1